MDDSSQKADNKVADETARMRRLVWAFIVTMYKSPDSFLSHRPIAISYVSFNHDTYKKTRCEI